MSGPSYDDVNVPVVFMVGAISMVLTFVTIWFVEGVFYQWKDGLDSVRDRPTTAVNTMANEAVNQQKVVLAGDAEKGIVAVDSVFDEVANTFQNNHGSESSGGANPTGDDHADPQAEGN